MAKYRVPIIDGGIARIPLTQGQETIIDVEDLPLVENYIWHAWWGGAGFYAVRNSHKIEGPPRRIYLHRVLLGLDRGDRIEGDHRDRNTLDNRRSNIRLASKAENRRNVHRPTRVGRSGYRGVFPCPCSPNWRARICVDYKSVDLGVFEDRIDAARAYDDGAVKYHGEFALTNVKLCLLPPLPS